MPVIFVYGMPPTVEQANLEGLIVLIQETVSDIEPLKISKDEVTVFFPSDLVKAGLGEELIVFVDGLLEKPGRTQDVLQKLVKTLRDKFADFVRQYLSQCKLVEVFIRPLYNKNTPFAFVVAFKKEES